MSVCACLCVHVHVSDNILLRTSKNQTYSEHVISVLSSGRPRPPPTKRLKSAKTAVRVIGIEFISHLCKNLEKKKFSKIHDNIFFFKLHNKRPGFFFSVTEIIFFPIICVCVFFKLFGQILWVTLLSLMSLSFLNMRTLLSTASKWTVESGSAFTDTTTSLPGRVSWTSKLMSTYKQSKIFFLKIKAFEFPDTYNINSNPIKKLKNFKILIFFQFKPE